MPNIVNGVVKFKQQVYPGKRDLYEKLATGQSPEALFITCSDSRISPNLVTQTEPGELFICRNAGNIVPPHTKATGGTTATIEYAVAVLEVPHIVICGHTECGAMKGAMDPGSLKDLPHVSKWLAYSSAAVEIVKEIGSEFDEAARMRMLIEQNVLLQMVHLKTHPYVAARHAAGKLQIHGWVYDIRSGNVVAYDDKQEKFLPVEERYAQEIEKLTKNNIIQTC
jgi:carbonic anhydrase